MTGINTVRRKAWILGCALGLVCIQAHAWQPTFVKAVVKDSSWIRINQLGYSPSGHKTAVLVSLSAIHPDSFFVRSAQNHEIVWRARVGESFGAYGSFTSTFRLNFSALVRRGWYYIQAGETKSPAFLVDTSVYLHTADFCLQYMRMQRNGFNPFLRDSCHQQDGYTVYAPVPDGTHIDVVGGWHDATDYLQYSTTSANATYHLLLAYRDFPQVFGDSYRADGLPGSNKIPDVIDEAKWGLDWLWKMHPKKDWLFNQLGDDRDHYGFHLPGLDSNHYDIPFQRPVYFCTGQPQGLGRYKNRTTGIASTAGKFASSFALGETVMAAFYPAFAASLHGKAASALALGIKYPGNCQTACLKSPYFYEEDNWKDDMELALAEWTRVSPNLKPATKDSFLRTALQYAADEPVTPWMGADTANHYQWYPFINLGHYALAKQLKGAQKALLLAYYRQGIERVWNKARTNSFYRGIPFIWCSNNLVVGFVTQCYWYRRLSGDNSFLDLEQACFDWLFGCNPWGASMVCGMPSWGDTPSDPHSSFWWLYHIPVTGGLVDGPIYTRTFKRQRQLNLTHPDEYELFQNDLAVYHDDAGDYSTNEPTMDGTASLIYLLAAKEAESR